MLGNVFHKVMQQLYDMELVTPAYLQATRKDTDRLKRLIRAAVLSEMNSVEVSGRNLVLEEVLLGYVRATLKHDIDLLAGSGSAGFRIIGLELRRETTFEGFRIKGYIDRMDSYKEGEVRIVDYKTGKVEDDDLLITDQNAAGVVEKLFGESNSGRPKIALQLFVYGLLRRSIPELSEGTHREFRVLGLPPVYRPPAGPCAEPGIHAPDPGEAEGDACGNGRSHRSLPSHRG